MGVEHRAVLLLQAQRESHISVAAMLQVSLEEQPLHLAAFGLLQRLDLVEGELEGAAGCQSGLEQSEFESGRCGVGGSGACDCHMLTV